MATVSARRAAFGLFLLYCSLIVSAELAEDADVLIINGADDLNEARQKHPALMVEYYAPWCGHCKALEPEYQHAANKLKKHNGAQIPRLAKCDATQAANKELASQVHVQGFPTIKFFRGDDVTDYNGGRSSADIVSWVLKRMGDMCESVNDRAAAEQFMARTGVRVLCFNYQGDDQIQQQQKDFQDVIEAVAHKHSNVHFAVTNDKDVFARLNPNGGVGCMLTRDFDDPQEVWLHGARTRDELESFVAREKEPLVQEFTQDRATQIFSSSVDIHFLLFVDKSKPNTVAHEDALRIVAKNNKGRALHVIMPSEQTDVMQYFGLKAESLPAAIILDMSQGMKQYRMPTDFKYNDADLQRFAESVYNGQLPPHLKSTDQKDDSADLVKTIVGKTFHERVIASSHDVLLQFYAPWCGHCKALAPKFQEVGKMLQSVADKVMVAMIDATENDVDHDKVNIEGFPTIMYFKAGNKQEPYDYTGAREVHDIVDFVQKHSSFSFAIDDEQKAKVNDEL